MYKTTIKVLILLFFILLSSLFPQWEERNNGLPDNWWIMGAIDACDSSHAVVVLPIEDQLSRIFITSDAGNTWSEKFYPENNGYFHIWDVSMVDTNNIWFCGDGNDAGTKIWASTDGGENWKIQYESSDTSFVVLEYIRMFDLNHGISMGSSFFDSPAPVLRTSDGGTNWIEMNQEYLKASYTHGYYRSIDFVNLNIGFFVKKWENLYKTFDGGKTWITVLDSVFGLETVNFYDENFGLASRMNGFIYRTIDGGDSWEQIDQDILTDEAIFSYLPKEPEKIWALQSYSEDLILFNSSDSGSSWTAIPLDSIKRGIDMVFTSNSNGWILTHYSVYYTNQGYITSSLNRQDITSKEKIKIYQNYPNPFNSSTRIRFDIQYHDHVTIEIYNTLGQKLEILLDKNLYPGNYKVVFDAKNLSSGVYYYIIRSGKFHEVNKMVLLQ